MTRTDYECLGLCIAWIICWLWAAHGSNLMLWVSTLAHEPDWAWLVQPAVTFIAVLASTVVALIVSSLNDSRSRRERAEDLHLTHNAEVDVLYIALRALRIAANNYESIHRRRVWNSARLMSGRAALRRCERVLDEVTIKDLPSGKMRRAAGRAHLILANLFDYLSTVETSLPSRSPPKAPWSGRAGVPPTALIEVAIEPVDAWRNQVSQD